MFRNTKTFSSFSVDDLQQAKQFYSETLGLDVVETPEGLELHIASSTPVFVYPSNSYTAPKHTVLNFPVKDIEAAVDELRREGCSHGALRPARPEDKRARDLQRRFRPARHCLVQ